MKDKYVVCWKSNVTGNEGRGTLLLSKHRASTLVSEMNGKFEQLRHWIEPAVRLVK